MRNLIIHAGGPKTGSSAIQNFLEMNADFLGHLGFLYSNPVGIVDKMEITSGNGYVLYKALVAEPDGSGSELGIIYDQNIYNNYNDYLSDMLNGYVSDGKTGICSSEYFARLQYYQWQRLFDAAFRIDIELKIIILVRDVVSYFQSEYDQRIKRHGETCSFQQFVDECEWSHFFCLSNLYPMFPGDKLVVKSFDRNRSRLLQTFFEAAGCAEIELPKEYVSPIVNRSLTNEERRILLEINSVWPDGLYATELSNILIQKYPNIRSQFSMTANELATLMEQYRPHVLWINNTFFGGKDEVRIGDQGHADGGVADLGSAIAILRECLDWSLGKIKLDSKGQSYVHLLTQVGRKPVPRHIADLPDDFDALGYLLLNHDVLYSGFDPVTHYLAFGKSEKRQYRLPHRNIWPENYERLLGKLKQYEKQERRHTYRSRAHGRLRRKLPW